MFSLLLKELIFLFSKKIYVSGMKYDDNTSKMTFFIKDVTEGFSKHLCMFVRPIIRQTKVHFKILELLVITFGTGR